MTWRVSVGPTVVHVDVKIGGHPTSVPLSIEVQRLQNGLDFGQVTCRHLHMLSERPCLESTGYLHGKKSGRKIDIRCAVFPSVKIMILERLLFPIKTIIRMDPGIGWSIE